MKPNVLFLAIATILLGASSCGPTESDSDKMARLTTERDSLRAVYAEVGDALTAVEHQLSMLDTTKKLLSVTTLDLQPTAFSHYFEIYGSVEADESIQIYPEAPGEVVQIPVREGQQVAKGQILMQLDAEVIRKNIAQVETSLELATDVYNRQKRLWDKKIGSELQFLEAKNNKEGLERQLETLRAQLDMSTIKAPFAGTIDEIFPKVGEMAAGGMPLVRLVNLNSVYIKADVSERYVAVVNKGTHVTVKIPSLNREMVTDIALTGQYINPNNRTFSVRVEVDNTDGQLKPNMLTSLRIRDFQQDSAVVVPSALIQQSPTGESFLYVLETSGNDHVVRKVTVQTGMSYEEHTHVTEGLKGNEVLIDRGSRSIKDGQHVQLAEQA